MRVVQVEPLKPWLSPWRSGPSSQPLLPTRSCRALAARSSSWTTATCDSRWPCRRKPIPLQSCRRWRRARDRSLEAAFTALMAQPGHLVERVADPTDAAWYVRVVADEVYLVPASGWHRPLGRAQTTGPLRP